MSEAALTQGSSQRPPPPAEYRFKPGQTGNPGGKPKRLQELHSLAVACYPQALRRLNELIDSRNEDTSKWAISLVLSYILGKPADSIVMLEGLKARLGESFQTPLMALAQQTVEAPAPATEPQVRPTLPPRDGGPPEAGSTDGVPRALDGPVATPVSAPAAEPLGFTMTPERAELLKQVAPEKAAPVLAGDGSTPFGPEPAVSLHCLYRTASGPCGDAPAPGGQWCAVHKALLFSKLGAK